MHDVDKLTLDLPPKTTVLKALILDLFNTLTSHEMQREDIPWAADILGVPRDVWSRALTEASGPRLTGAIREPVEIMRYLTQAVDVVASDEQLEAAASSHRGLFTRVLLSVPDANVDGLRKLRDAGLRLALLSNCDSCEIESWSESRLKGLFDVELFSCHCRMAKPDPAFYRECLRQLNVTPQECLFVGDGGHEELAGARAVGLGTVLFTGVIQHTWPERIPALLADADFQVSSLEQLASLPMVRRRYAIG
jgi:putative hydrolase of the HAD superfamily